MPDVYQIYKALHVLSIVLWVGGMIFAHFVLRPAVAGLSVADRLTLMADVLRRFFALVSVASLVALLTGYLMVGNVAAAASRAGGSFVWPSDWTVMAVLGTLMVLLFGHIRFALFPKLRRAVEAQEWEAGGMALAKLRTWVSVNLAIGLVLIAWVILA